MDKIPQQRLHRSYRLCSNHFEDSQFMNSDKKRLVWNALPTLFDVPNPPKTVGTKRKIKERPEIKAKQRKTTAIPPKAAPTVTLPPTEKEQKLQKEVYRLRTKVWRLKQKLKGPHKASKSLKTLQSLLNQFLPTVLVALILTQVKVAGKKGAEIRWPSADKMLALSVLYHSRKAYKLLQGMFKLPSISTLKRTLRRTNVYPGFNENLLNALKTKVQNFSIKDQQCVLIFDEMSIKSGLTYDIARDCIEGYEDFGFLGRTDFIANHATVFMVRGLYSKWKQPLCYFLSSGSINSDKLRQLTTVCITKLHDIGLHVRATICDQGSNDRSFLEHGLGVTVSKPYFYVNNRKIYVFYDPPHLVKNIRNNLMKHGFVQGTKAIKWQYIAQFYEFDSRLGIRMAPKLTDFHINLRPFAKMRVHLATQVLSHTVAAGISTLIALGKIEKKGHSTAEFVQFFDKLFNVFNSSNVTSNQPMGHAISEHSGHIAFLGEAYRYLDTLKLPNGRFLPCVDGWKMSINALRMLWSDLHVNGENGFKFMLTNRLNQDCLENLFCVVRGRGGFCDNPNAEQFRSAFRQIIVKQLLVKSDSSNCKSDSDRILLDLTSISCVEKKQQPRKPFKPIVFDQTVSVSDIVSTLDGLAVENVACYIAGYVLKKMQIDCSYCSRKFVLKALPTRHQTYAFLKNKRYSENCNLVYPAMVFVKFIEELEIMYTVAFPKVCHLQDVMHVLIESTRHKIDTVLDCNNGMCMDRMMYGLKLYMKVRIHATLKRTNSENKESKGKRNKKLLKLMHV